MPQESKKVSGSSSLKEKTTFAKHGWVLEALAGRPGCALRHVDVGPYRGSSLTDGGEKVYQAARQRLETDGFIEAIDHTCWKEHRILHLTPKAVRWLNESRKGASLDFAKLRAGVTVKWPHDSRRIGWVCVAERPDKLPAEYPPRQFAMAVASLHSVPVVGNSQLPDGEYRVVSKSDDAEKDGVVLYRMEVGVDEFGERFRIEEWTDSMSAFGIECGWDYPIAVKEPGTRSEWSESDDKARMAASEFRHTISRSGWAAKFALLESASERLAKVRSGKASEKAVAELRRVLVEVSPPMSLGGIPHWVLDMASQEARPSRVSRLGTKLSTFLSKARAAAEPFGLS